MVVWRYFYVDIDPIAASGGIKNEGVHNKISTTICNDYMEG
jgi:hypothetical protein